MMQQPLLVKLENRAWRGLRVYTPSFIFDGKGLVLEITTHAKQGPIVIQEYWDYNENGKNHSYGGYIKETFKTFEQCLQFIKEKYGLECKYPKWTKEMTSDWTWEQNIRYAEMHENVNSVPFEKIEKMVVGKNLKCIEIEELKYIRDNPKTKTQPLRELFDYIQKEEFNHSLLSRLCHDYGNNRTPLITQESGNPELDKNNCYQPVIKDEGWLITENGLRVIKEYEEAIKEKGFFDGSLY